MTYKKFLLAFAVISALALLGCSVGSSDAGAGDSSDAVVQIVLDLPASQPMSLKAPPGPTYDPSVTWARVIIQIGSKPSRGMDLAKDPVSGAWKGQCTIAKADEGLTTFNAAAGSGAGYSSGGTWLYKGSNTQNTGTAGLTTIVIPTLDVTTLRIEDWTAEVTVVGTTNATIVVVPTNPDAEVFFLAWSAYTYPGPTAAAIISANQRAVGGVCSCVGLEPGEPYALYCVARLGTDISAVASVSFETSGV
jgi:hypothetical protein